MQRRPASELFISFPVPHRVEQPARGTASSGTARRRSSNSQVFARCKVHLICLYLHLRHASRRMLCKEKATAKLHATCHSASVCVVVCVCECNSG